MSYATQKLNYKTNSKTFFFHDELFYLNFVLFFKYLVEVMTCDYE